MHTTGGMPDNTNPRQPRRGKVRRILDRLDAHVRLQRELLWHPRLGLAGARVPVPAAKRVARRRTGH